MTLADTPREFKVLPLDVIDAPSLPTRAAMDDDKLSELAASIRVNGLIQPISVARVGDRYEVVAGHRRRIACERAGCVFVPCLIYPTRDDALDAIQFAENTHREDVNPVDEAIWFAQLLEGKCGGDIDKLAALVGEKVSYIDGRLLLFHGHPEVLAALQADKIGIGVAHELNKIPDPEYARYYLDSAIRGGATVSVVMAWVTEWKNLFGTPRPASASAAEPLAAASVPEANPFACYICGKANNTHLIRHVPIHQHCQLAILDPILEGARGDSVAAAPTTDARRD